MKRKVMIIGIGAGNPDYMTIQAIDAMNRVSVFFIPDKGREKAELGALRRRICERFIKNDAYRMVDFISPARGKSDGSYRAGIESWRAEVADLYERLLIEELGDEECGAFLVWGDPSLYDGTMRVLDAVRARGNVELEYDVVPGISSVQALAAQHKVALNRIGETITITTGRKLAEGFPNNVDSIVVMLDTSDALGRLDGDFDIHWGAYVGTEDEILVEGKLRDVCEEIERLREAARKRHGWVMDSYMLTRPRDDRKE